MLHSPLWDRSVPAYLKQYKDINIYDLIIYMYRRNRKFVRKSVAKKGYKKRFAKKNNKKYEVVKYPKMSLMKSPNLIVPERFFTKLRYVDVDTPLLDLGTTINVPPLLSGVGNGYFAFTTYRLNDIYDPNVAIASSGVGGYTSLGNFYGRWRVRAAKIKSTAYNSSIYAMIWMMSATNEQTPNTTIASAWSTARSREMNEYVKTAELDIQASGHSSRTMSMYIDCSKLSQNAMYLTDKSFAGTTNLSLAGNASPTNVLKLDNCFMTLAGGNVGGAHVYVEHSTTITYYVEFFDRLNNKIV